MSFLFKTFFFSFLCLTSYLFAEGNSKIYKVGWSVFEPYQYTQEGTKSELSKLTGIDIEFIRNLLKSEKMKFVEIPWEKREEALASGEVDILLGMTQTPERLEKFRASIPYRKEEDALFLLKTSQSSYHIQTMSDLLHSWSQGDIRIGVIKGFSYSDPHLNAFIHDPKNQSYIVYADNEKENVHHLLHGEIDGFLADSLSGATAIWKESRSQRISQIPFGPKVSIAFMFNPKVVSEKDLNAFNATLEASLKKGKYEKLVTWYLYPLILAQSLDTVWFKVIELIGIISFAIAGVMIAYKEKATFIGTFVLALLPGFGSTILRDLIIGRYPISVIKSPLPICSVFFVAIVLFIGLRMKGRLEDAFMEKIEKIEWLFSSIAISTLAINGVMIALMIKAYPLWIWGPFFSFLSSVTGLIFKDLLCLKRSGIIFGPTLKSEIPILWGLILSLVLMYESHVLDLDMIFFTVSFCALGTFVTFWFVRHFKIQAMTLIPKNNSSPPAP
jgi:polar amino acid transport system substrate-binding protein